MPNYDYKCNSCSHTEEIHQSIKDKAITECPKCKQQTFERVIYPTALQFKGMGFHVTDYKLK